MSTPVGITPKTASEIQANLKQLETSAHALNKLSDQLTKKVAEIEDTINRLNLGVTADVRIESWANEDGTSSSVWRLAYGKESGKWGFVIEYLSENLNLGPDAESYESWPFKDSPREQRIRAVEKIPMLLEALVKKSNEVAEEISRKVSYTESLAATLLIAKPESTKK
jgi:hypothetical protein